MAIVECTAAPSLLRQLPLGRSSLVLSWVLASAVGGLGFEVVVSFNVLAAALLLGLLLAAPQWLVLRTYRSNAWRWLVVTTPAVLLAWVFGAITVVVLEVAVVAPLSRRLTAQTTPEFATVVCFALAALVAGGLVGLVQAPQLARANSPWTWAAASGIGVVLFWGVLIGLHLPFGGLATTNALVHVGSGLAGGTAYGLVTGPVLARPARDKAATFARRTNDRPSPTWQ